MEAFLFCCTQSYGIIGSMIKPGEKFPRIQGRAYDGIAIDTERFFGEKPFVAYFYPKDGSSGCTLQAQDFTNIFYEFDRLGVALFGVSTDPLGSHEAFCMKYDITIPLLSDERGDWARQLGILDEHGMAKRTTFYVNIEGVIEKIWTNVNPVGHQKTVLEHVKEILHEEKFGA